MDAEQIVRLLAADGPPIADGWSYGADVCMLCGEDTRSEPTKPERHGVACPWRLAREWASNTSQTG